ncbi:hypothetical protein ON010_g4018 [Phytophthora cinnamomi]|nr:hypothetical protein ON010_g4018 [Phytophthora cinnamomi]
MGREIWEGIQYVYTLTSQNRGKTDLEWFAALRRLRRSAPQKRTLLYLILELAALSEMPAWVQLQNISLTRTLTSWKQTIGLKRLAKQREISQNTIKELLEEVETLDSSRDRAVATCVKLAVGAPITLTFKIEESAGLCNGTNGIIYDFIFPSGTDLAIVLVQITDLHKASRALKLFFTRRQFLMLPLRMWRSLAFDAETILCSRPANLGETINSE